MLNMNIYYLNFIPNYLLNKSWLSLSKFYLNIKNYNSKLLLLKSRFFRRSNFNKIKNYWKKKWVKFFFSSSVVKNQFKLALIPKNTIRGKVKVRSTKNFLIFKNFYLDKRPTNSVTLPALTGIQLRKQSKDITRPWRTSRGSLFSLKLGLFNLFFLNRKIPSGPSFFNLRKVMYSFPDRNKPTWEVIREIFKPRKLVRNNLSYAFNNSGLFKLRQDFKRRSFVPKIFFKNSLYMYVRRRRKSINDFFNLNYLYQKKMTRFLFKFKLLSMSSTLQISTNNLFNSIKHSGILVNFSNIPLFFSRNWIFLNGHEVHNKYIYVFKKDIVSFYLSWSVLRFLISSFYTIRFKTFELNRYYYLFILKKRKKKNVQYWINKYDSVKLKKQNSIESDFLSLNFIILRDYDYRDFLLRQIPLTIPFGVLFNFNWKFLN